jgi:putative ABC transport system substrate-binding protein
MRRREFITLVGGAVTALPFAVRAQQPALPVIGLMGVDNAASQSRMTAAFVIRLRELGWTEGRNVIIEYRWAEGRTERFAEIATEFVQRNVSIILTHNTHQLLQQSRQHR